MEPRTRYHHNRSLLPLLGDNKAMKVIWHDLFDNYVRDVVNNLTVPCVFNIILGAVDYLADKIFLSKNNWVSNAGCTVMIEAIKTAKK